MDSAENLNIVDRGRDYESLEQVDFFFHLVVCIRFKYGMIKYIPRTCYSHVVKKIQIFAATF